MPRVVFSSALWYILSIFIIIFYFVNVTPTFKNLSTVHLQMLTITAFVCCRQSESGACNMNSMNRSLPGATVCIAVGVHKASGLQVSRMPRNWLSEREELTSFLFCFLSQICSNGFVIN